jgi:hypothetical protein
MDLNNGKETKNRDNHVKIAHNRTFHKMGNIGVLFSPRKEKIKYYLDGTREEDQFSHEFFEKGQSWVGMLMLSIDRE